MSNKPAHSMSQPQEDGGNKWVPKQLIEKDFEDNFLDSTKETLRVLYADRIKSEHGETITTETTTQIIYRVAKSVALAELKYQLSPEELIHISLDDALSHPIVVDKAESFADCIGNQFFWANTPANINARPEIALKVLQYWAHGTLHGYVEEDIWLESDNLRKEYKRTVSTENSITILSKHQFAMGKLADELQNKGCLAACGVAYVTDSLEGIQEAARIESMATKASMGMGLNTSKLRPWSSLLSTGAYASGPDRFYEKTISKAVEAVAQGGRRGGALIELRNSNHPDILFFIDKKRLTPPPSITKIYQELKKSSRCKKGESHKDLKRRLLNEAVKKYGEAFVDYAQRQSYLKNTNITVLLMPGFMQAVADKQFYPARFNDKNWDSVIFDPRKDTGTIDKLTKEKVFEEYSVDLQKYPEALEAASKQFVPEAQLSIGDGKVKLRGYLYAPEVLDRIVEGMHDSGEPGIMFYDIVNDANANDHSYDLDTCNPCGEQCLPAGPGKDGRVYMGNCNLSSLHAAHPTFWNADGGFDHVALAKITTIQQRFMDNVTDVSWYPLPAQNMTARMERRNGGGFAGIAEYLSRLNQRFGSLQGCEAVRDLFFYYTEASVKASIDLAKERGVYPLWKGSQYEKTGIKIRNSCLVNNAPTGTLAQAMQTSWGVDPHNGIVFSRKARYRSVDFTAPGFEALMRKQGAWPNTEEGVENLLNEIKANHHSVQGLKSIPTSVQQAFPIRVEITPKEYIEHLAAIHRGAAEVCPYAFNAVSNTCSIPLNFSKEEIKDAIFLAYRTGVKDLTFYPDGSRLSQPVEKIAAQDYEKSLELLDVLELNDAQSLDINETEGRTYKVRVGTPEGYSTMHVSLNHLEDNPGQLIEIYARMGKAGALDGGLFEAIGRISSAFLQYAAKFGPDERQQAEELIIKQLVGIQSGNPAFHKFVNSEKADVVTSPCDGLAKTIKKYRQDIQQKELDVKDVKVAKDIDVRDSIAQGKVSITVVGKACGQCTSQNTTKLDGCTLCNDCGYSRCN